jgi:hypothetical protein
LLSSRAGKHAALDFVHPEWVQLRPFSAQPAGDVPEFGTPPAPWTLDR